MKQGQHKTEPASERRGKGAERAQRPLIPWAAFFHHHIASLRTSLKELLQAPIANLMTVAVIGIAIALPAGLYVLLQSVQVLTHGLEDSKEISLFLKPGVSDEQALALVTRLKVRREIATVTYISPEQAMEEFKRQSGMEEALAALDHNPLPGVVVVKPAAKFSNPQHMESLLGRLRILDEVEMAQLDMAWLQRLQALTELARRGVLILGGLLGLAVLMIVGNTIRLAVQNQREEIEIVKLLGATDAFVRRPFLYRGFWYGLGGGLVAWLLCAIALSLLQDPVARLSALYDQRFSLHFLDLQTGALLLLAAACLGWVGAWLAVGRHLRSIEPS